MAIGLVLFVASPHTPFSLMYEPWLDALLLGSLHPWTSTRVIDVALALSYPQTSIINQPLENADSLSCFLLFLSFDMLLALSIGVKFFL